VPSRVTFFNTLMRLNHILSLSLKILVGFRFPSLFAILKRKTLTCQPRAVLSQQSARVLLCERRVGGERCRGARLVIEPLARSDSRSSCVFLLSLFLMYVAGANAECTYIVRWDPARQDPVFFDQSVALHCAYYHLQILIHRPFIPMIRKSAPTVWTYIPLLELPC
jgi:hypothetical protein